MERKTKQRIVLLVLIFIAGALLHHEVTDKFQRNWEELPLYDKVEKIEKSRSRDEYCTSGDHVRRCNEMYDEMVRETMEKYGGKD